MTQVRYSRYGSASGQLVVYFHGVPGGINEPSVFDDCATRHTINLLCLDRFSIEQSLAREDYYRGLATQIKGLAGTKPVTLIGFSIGAHVALEVAALLQGQVRQVHLISAGAPLAAGDFLDSMAGSMIFKLAQRYPLLFWLLTQLQRGIALLAPAILFRMLFANCAGYDKNLSQDPQFKQSLTHMLKHCFVQHAAGYMRDIKFYTAWAGGVSYSATSTEIWHGTADNWSPFSMAEYWNDAIAGDTRLNPMAGLSHYSCLYAAVPEICKIIEQEHRVEP